MSKSLATNTPQDIAPAATGGTQVLEVISRAASDPNIDIDKFERLMTMYERVAAKQAEAEFYSAFSDMQSEIPVITKKGEIKVNGQVRSTFARNEDIQEIVKPILKDHGFMLTFRNEYPEPGKLKVVGTLAHKAGHKIEGEFLAAADTSGSKNDIQAFGSSQAYGQRYITKGLLNIAERGEDNDGSGTTARITEEQIADINALIDEIGTVDYDGFLRYMKIGRLDDMPSSQFRRAIKALEQKRKAAK